MKHTSQPDSQDLGFALVSAAEVGNVPCLAHLLRKGDEIEILTTLCR